MSEEKVYTFNEYVLGYDSGRDNDRSCLTISKILNDNMYVMSTLYDGSAEVISTILDSLQQKVEQLEKEIDRLNNIINELEKWLNEYYKSNRKWYNTELSNHDKQYYEEIYRNTEFMIVKFLKQLKELEENK